jgi:glucosamine kinase
MDMHSTKYLVVESGSTKSDWILISGEEQIRYSTMGLNPYFHDSETVYQALIGNDGLTGIREEISAVYFYGAGCSAPELNAIISEGLQRFFGSAHIQVDHDLTACAFATFKGDPIISCIIGTGSNSCFYDGHEIREAVPALGYILGDEGSGSFFGKRLLTDFLYHKLPGELASHLRDECALSKTVIVENVYRKPNANVYLASFMPVLAKFRESEYVQKLLTKGFGLFLKEHVQCFQEYPSVKTSFVGSIASIFDKELLSACLTHGVNCGEIIRKPIDGLVRYHVDRFEKQQS